MMPFGLVRRVSLQVSLASDSGRSRADVSLQRIEEMQRIELAGSVSD